jgi:hypothetical protein
MQRTRRAIAVGNIVSYLTETTIVFISGNSKNILSFLIVLFYLAVARDFYL